MKVKFLGAAETVTGSRYLLTTDKKRVLVDCGLFQGLKELRLRNWEPFPVPPASIDAVVLTHAHLDHSGYLPLLVREGFKGPIYCTPATRDLCEVLLRDSAHIQEEDTRRANKYGYTKHSPALPLYTVFDANEALKQFKTIAYGHKFYLDATLHFNFQRAGHILGSSIISFNANGTLIVFTGDLGRPKDPVLKPPVPIEKADYLFIESTYGNRLHKPSDAKEELGQIIRDTAKKGGTVIIPAFAVGRAQTIMYLLYSLLQENAIPKLPIYLDSPMAEDATAILDRNCEEQTLLLDTCHRICQIAEYTSTKEQSKALYSNAMPKVIISASGMAEGGRVLHHIKHYGPDHKNSIVFCGFQAAGTRGAQMLKGDKEVKIHGSMIPINARVEQLDNLSSHVDYAEAIAWMKGITPPPKKVFLTHGEPDAAEHFKEEIERELGWNVKIPKYLEEVTL